MLHGYMSDSRSFYYQQNFFSNNGFFVTSPDFPGFGSSAPLTAAWSVGDYADWLGDFIAARNLFGAHIMAHSFGARVAIKLLSKGNVAGKVVIVGGAGIVKPRTLSYRVKVVAYRLVRRVAPSFAESRFGSREYRTLPPVMKQSYKKIVNEDLLVDASKIQNDVLLVYGREDGVTPVNDEGIAFHSAICRSVLVTMPGDHFCFCSRHQLFNEIALDFLSGSSPYRPRGGREEINGVFHIRSQDN